MEAAIKPPPGLRRQGGRLLWRATKAAVAAGYPVKSANLTQFADRPDRLREQCEKLQREMLEWCSGTKRRGPAEFDGRFKGIFDLYENDPKSPFHGLKESTQHPYRTYLRMLRAQIGHCHVDRTDGRDVQDWFAEWCKPEVEGFSPPMLAKANMALSVLKAALAFAIVCRKPGCSEFRACIPKRFEQPKPRRVAIGADLVSAARREARTMQQPGAALAYALQFEGPMRQWDVIGKWVLLSDPSPSAIIHRNRKWIGPTWNDVDKNLILRWKPTKTEHSSGEEIVVDFHGCPMIMEEIQLKLENGDLTGPLILDSRTGRPFQHIEYVKVWKAVAKAAEIPPNVWNRDLRKSGSTEARRAGAPIDDVKKVMGHTDDTDITQRVYDLADLEAFRRVSAARLAFRKSLK